MLKVVKVLTVILASVERLLSKVLHLMPQEATAAMAVKVGKVRLVAIPMVVMAVMVVMVVLPSAVR